MSEKNPPPFRDRLVWDGGSGEIRDGGIRYMLIRPDGLMGMLHRLPEEMRDATLAALAASIHDHGGGSARKYRDMGAGDGAALLSVIAATAPQLGWGLWRFTPSADGVVELEVGNSPFAAGHGAADMPVCAAIAGMLSAVAGMVLGAPAEARETACAAMGVPACRFQARRRPGAATAGGQGAPADASGDATGRATGGAAGT